MAKKEQLARGDRVRILPLRQDETGERVPDDVVGLEGTIEWITPGFAGEKGVFEIRLSDGRVVNLYATEIEAIE